MDEVGRDDTRRGVETGMYDEMLKLIAELPARRPGSSASPRLDDLFARLSEPSASAEAYAIEDEIWAIWTAHPDSETTVRMDRAIACVAGRRHEEAEALLDDLIAGQPAWAEAWNKRATLLFLQGRDPESARDIRQTLLLEPRHFGALSGFAQICLRHGQTVPALVALEAALRVHPHLPSARNAVAQLRRLHPPTLH